HLLHVRAPPGAVPWGRAHRLHPGEVRRGHRAEQARPPGRPVRQTTAGPGATHRPGRRRAGGPARPQRGPRRDRVRAPVHVHAGYPQGRGGHHHVRGPRQPAHQRLDQGGGPRPPARDVSVADALPRPGRCAVMGVVNVTADSFSDGGRYLAHDAALEHARRLVSEGADLLDVGGESTRPGAIRVDETDEERRVLPLVRALEAEGVTVSVDTMRARVAARALSENASIINDVSGGLADADMLPVVAEHGCPAILMHWVSPDEYRAGAGGRADYGGDVVGAVRDHL